MNPVLDNLSVTELARLVICAPPAFSKATAMLGVQCCMERINVLNLFDQHKSVCVLPMSGIAEWGLSFSTVKFRF
jgi:hypothetical protein